MWKSCLILNFKLNVNYLNSNESNCLVLQFKNKFKVDLIIKWKFKLIF
jgi:hypothetical protein